jgi:hypothetical protein
MVNPTKQLRRNNIISTQSLPEKEEKTLFRSFYLASSTLAKARSDIIRKSTLKHCLHVIIFVCKTYPFFSHKL